MAYLEELAALQRWVKSAAGLNSIRLSIAPPKVARPVILWEAPSRRRERNLSRYTYVNRVRQFGKIYAQNLDTLLQAQEALLGSLEDAGGVLPIYDATGAEIGKMKAVEIEFEEATELDVPFVVSYETTYSRPKPALPPAATTVKTRIHVHIRGQ